MFQHDYYVGPVKRIHLIFLILDFIVLGLPSHSRAKNPSAGTDTFDVAGANNNLQVPSRNMRRQRQIVNIILIVNSPANRLDLLELVGYVHRLLLEIN